MKKVLWLLTMLIASVVANAADGNLYVRGLNGEWNNYSPNKMTETSTGQYILENAQLIKTGEFKIADDDYTVQYGHGDAGNTISEDNLSLKVAKGGNNIFYTVTGKYNIKLDCTDENNPTVTFEYVGEADITITYGLRGQFTTTDWSNFEFTDEGNDVWSGKITPTVASGSFGGLQMTNGVQSKWYTPASATELSETNTTMTLQENGQGGNPTFNLTTGKEYSFTFNIATGELKMTFESEQPAGPTTLHKGSGMSGAEAYSEVKFVSAQPDRAEKTAKATYTLTATDGGKMDISLTFEGLDQDFVGLVDACYVIIDGIGETSMTLADGVYTATANGTFTEGTTYTGQIKRMSSAAYFGGDLLFPFEFTYTAAGGDEPQPTYPTTAAVIGFVNGATSWDANGVTLSSTEEGVFSGKVTLGEYFRIKLDGTEFGGESDGTEVAAGTPVKYVQTNGNAFKTVAGEYTVTINCKDNTVTLTAGTTGGDDDDPTPGTYPTTAAVIGFVNGATSWDADGAALSSTEEGVFSGKVTLGEYFRIKLDGTEFGGETDGTEVAAGTPVTYVQTSNNAFKTVAGEYTVTINCKDNTVTLTADTTGDDDDDPTPSSDVPEHLYMIGNVNGTAWSTSAPAEMTKTENVFTLAATIDEAAEGSGVGYFSFCTATGADWNELNSAGDRFGAAEENTPVSFTDNVFEAELTHYVVDVNNSACQSYVVAAGKYDVTVTFNDGKATMKVVSQGSGVADINADEAAEAVYYNLQGVRVVNPANGLYIEVRGNQVRKVMVK